MTRPTQITVLIFLVTAASASAGCQRSMSGGMPSSPFGTTAMPANTMAPVGSSPLIPLGPITGATRVPPPPTNSTGTNAYLGPPSASTFDPRGASMAQAPLTQPQLAQAPLSNASPMANVHPPSAFRDSLGGMPINDLTATTPATYLPVAYPVGSYPQNAYPPAPVAAYNPAVQQASLASPANLMRPIDAAYPPAQYAGVPAPRYRGMQTQTGYGVAPAAYATGDAWQSTPQPGVSPMPAMGFPSTAPPAMQPVVQSADGSLPWRSPTTAR